MAGLNETPRADRVHIAFFGRTNAGKSSTINLLTGGETALVSPVAGTTTDPVYKSMELLPVGPVVLIDTAGTDDETQLGAARAAKTKEVAQKTDVAVVLLREEESPDETLAGCMTDFEKRGVPVVTARNFEGPLPEDAADGEIPVNAKTGEGKEALLAAIRSAASATEDVPLTKGLVRDGDIVLLVMPQDIQAPKGRLILPQVQTIRDLLDANCRVLCVKTDDLPGVFSDLARKPALVITDSQAFSAVSKAVPEEIPLTSFSVLMSKKRGDIEAFAKGARAIEALRPGDRVLIAEACTHHALKGDIAREKIPALLEKKAGGPLAITVSSGPSFPENLESYKLIIQCGGCMINRANMLSRIAHARQAGVPIANFGTVLAQLTGILDRIVY